MSPDFSVKLILKNLIFIHTKQIYIFIGSQRKCNTSIFSLFYAIKNKTFPQRENKMVDNIAVKVKTTNANLLHFCWLGASNSKCQEQYEVIKIIISNL